MTVTVRRATTAELAPREIKVLRRMMAAAWEGQDGSFGDSDWEHGTGGVHVLVEEAGEVLSHGSVVERTLEVDGALVRTGYVEAVATWPRHQRRGYASLVMEEIGEIIRADYPLGGLSTPVPAFYERLGWEPWRGRTFVRTPNGLERTADDDGGVMILRTPASPEFDLGGRISCDWREGDVW
jgi:aminoglycoside 2'-N-acetyltransferase I